MTPTVFDVQRFDVAKFDAILSRGLSPGIGSRTGTMCIEAAICAVLDLPHGDDPGCVASAVRRFKISLNDFYWSSPTARAKGLRDLGLAQLGSFGTVNDEAFLNSLSEKLIRRLIPHLFRRAPVGMNFAAVADRCEQDATKESVAEAARAAEAAWATMAAEAAMAAMATWAARAARAAEAARAARAAVAAVAAWAAMAARAAETAMAARAAEAAMAAREAEAAMAAKNRPPLDPDFYLNMVAQLALETLRDLNSPGVQLLEPAK